MSSLSLAAVLAAAGCAPGSYRAVRSASDPPAASAGVGGITATRLTTLEGRVSHLHQRLDELAEEQVRLREKLEGLEAKRRSTRRGPLSLRDVQRALAAAGFYNGPIDGKIGPQTKQAIEAFQRANGLRPDGVVGKRTRARLAEYLEDGR